MVYTPPPPSTPQRRADRLPTDQTLLCAYGALSVELGRIVASHEGVSELLNAWAIARAAAIAGPVEPDPRQWGKVPPLGRVSALACTADMGNAVVWLPDVAFFRRYSPRLADSTPPADPPRQSGQQWGGSAGRQSFWSWLWGG